MNTDREDTGGTRKGTGGTWDTPTGPLLREEVDSAPLVPDTLHHIQALLLLLSNTGTHQG